MAVYHQLRTRATQQRIHPGCIVSRIPADMGKHHVYAFHLELQQLGANACHIAMVDIAAYGTHHRAYGLQPQQQVNVADVPGVPNLIAVLEMDGVTVIHVLCVSDKMPIRFIPDIVIFAATATVGICLPTRPP